MTTTVDHDPVLALIPARGGSQSIPKKNLAEVNGIPLVARAIRCCMAATTVTDIVVSTDDEEIRAVAESEGATAQGRPDEFAHDNTIQEVDRLLCWMTQEWERSAGQRASLLLLVYPTSPLRQIETLDRCARRIRDDGFDSALALYEDKTYLWRVDGGTASPTNYSPELRGPRQKEAWNQWLETKSMYAMRRDLLLSTGCRLGGRISSVAVDQWEAIDVDSPVDLAVCNALVSSGALVDPLLSGHR